MRLSAYTCDIGPSQNIGMVIAEALKQQHRIAFVGNDKPGTKDFFDPKPDVLLTGLSSRELHGGIKELELGAQAHELGIPWVILADTHRSWGRQFACGKVNDAILLAAAPDEENDARAFGYQDVRYAGGPPLWQDYASAKPARIERANPDDKVVMVVGNKNACVIDAMCESVVAACEAIFGKDWELIFKPHPNEDPATQNAERRAKILADIKVLQTTERTTNLIGAVDCPIFYPGATDTIAAAYMRKPAICFEDDLSLQQLKAATGVGTWFPSESGACVKATSDNIRAAIETMLSCEGAAEITQRQQSAYPDMPTGERVESRIVKLLAGLANK